MTQIIKTEEELRKLIGKAPQALSKKKISFLDKHSLTFLENCGLIVIASQAFPEKIKLLSASHCGMDVVDGKTLNISYDQVDDAEKSPCAMYILVNSFEESLRINGDVSISNGVITVNIFELYFHCAKSIMRSNFWEQQFSGNIVEAPQAECAIDSPEVDQFLNAAPFLLVFTQNAQQEADLSPRGDPSGFVKRLDKNRLLIPERPGNKIADSLTNLLSNQTISLAMLCPGSNQVMRVTGRAEMTSHGDYLEMLEESNKVPKIAILLHIESVEFDDCLALGQANVWDKSSHKDRSILPSLGKIVADQLQQEEGVLGKKSLFGKVVGKSLASATETLIQNDYKNNLY